MCIECQFLGISAISQEPGSTPDWLVFSDRDTMVVMLFAAFPRISGFSVLQLMEIGIKVAVGPAKSPEVVDGVQSYGRWSRLGSPHCSAATGNRVS